MPTGAVSTRDRILTTAAERFADQGVKATTIAQIEAAVGLRPGSGGVHRYFASKDDLVRAVLERQIATTAAIRDEVDAWPRPDPDDLDAYLEAVGRHFLDQAERTRAVTLIGFREGRDLFERYPELRQRNFEEGLATIADHLREAGGPGGIDPEAAAYVLMSPLLYHRAMEWVTGEPALGIDDDRLVRTWAGLFGPILRRLLAEPDGPT